MRRSRNATIFVVRLASDARLLTPSARGQRAPARARPQRRSLSEDVPGRPRRSSRPHSAQTAAPGRSSLLRDRPEGRSGKTADFVETEHLPGRREAAASSAPGQGLRAGKRAPRSPANARHHIAWLPRARCAQAGARPVVPPERVAFAPLERSSAALRRARSPFPRPRPIAPLGPRLRRSRSPVPRPTPSEFSGSRPLRPDDPDGGELLAPRLHSRRAGPRRRPPGACGPWRGRSPRPTTEPVGRLREDDRRSDTLETDTTPLTPGVPAGQPPPFRPKPLYEPGLMASGDP